MARVTAAILDHEVALRTEAKQSENTQSGKSETSETYLSLELTFFQLLHGKEILV